MYMMETTGPSKFERELKSMQSGGGSLIAVEPRALSMMIKNLQGEGGKTVLPAPSTVSVSTLPNATSVNHTAESTPAVPVVRWKGLTSTHTVSNLDNVNHFPYHVSIATSKLNTTTSSMSCSDLSLLTGGSGNSTRKKEKNSHKVPPKETKWNK